MSIDENAATHRNPARFLWLSPAHA
jgi:hypothetical protein